MRIVLQFIIIAKHRPPAVFITFENSQQPAGQFITYLLQRIEMSRCGRIFYLKIIAVIKMVLAQTFNDQEVHGHPYRSAPVGVAAVHIAVTITRHIWHTHVGAIDLY